MTAPCSARTSRSGESDPLDGLIIGAGLSTVLLLPWLLAESAAAFTPQTLALGVFLGVFVLCYVAYIPWAGNVAASFVACAGYFSMIAANVFPNAAATTAGEYAMAGIAELFYILIGFVAGWITIEIDKFARGIGTKNA